MYKNKYFQSALVAALTTAAVVTVAPTADAAFTDVTPNTELSTAVEKLVNMNIISGYADGTFKPNKHITRGEFAKIMSLMERSEKGLNEFSSSFSDVPNSHWASKYVGYVSIAGYLTGYTNGQFGVDDTLTRAQFAKIIQTRAGMRYSIDLPFTDVPKGAWYEEGVKYLLGTGITTGTSATTFSPDAAVTRGQLAIFLDRGGMLQPLPSSTDPMGDLATFAKPDQLQGPKDFEKVMAILKGNKAYFSAIDYFAPHIAPDDNAIYYGNGSKTYVYGIYENVDEMYPEYISVLTFGADDLESFRMFTTEQFIEYTNENLKGPKQLHQMVKTKYGEDAQVFVYGEEEGAIMFLDEANAYIEFNLSRVVTSPTDNSTTPYAYVLKPKKLGEIYDYEVEELSPIYELKLQKGEVVEWASVEYVEDMDSYEYEASADAVYVTKSDGTLVFYPYMSKLFGQVPLVPNAKLKVQTTKANGEMGVYEYDF